MKISHIVKEDPQITIAEFMKSYNSNLPERFSKMTVELLQKFKATHMSFFKNGDLWSLEQHRKRILDWMPIKTDTSK